VQAAQLIPYSSQQLLGKCCANACSTFSLVFIAGFISEPKLIAFIVLDDFSKACLQLHLLDMKSPRCPYAKQTAKLQPSPGSAHAEACLPPWSGEIRPGRDVGGGRMDALSRPRSGFPTAMAWLQLEGWRDTGAQRGNPGYSVCTGVCPWEKKQSNVITGT